MDCVICKLGQTSQGETTVTLVRELTTIVVRAVPAQVCENCGEAYLDEEVSANVLALAERAVTDGAEVEILRYAA